METSLLHQKIKRYEGRKQDDFSKELINEFKDWLAAIEKYIADVEQDNFKYGHLVMQQEILIDYLVKLLVITGNANKSVHFRIMDADKLHSAVDFLFKNGDRVNHENLYVVASLLDIAKKEGREIKDMVEFVSYARGEERK